MKTGKKIKVTIETVNNKTSEISVSENLTGYQLKNYIYQNVSQTLGVLGMKLYYAGVKIEDDKLLSSYKMVQNSSIKILQLKCQLDEIEGLIVSYEEDQISGETKTARMPCGHVIGRDCMTQYIRSLVESNVYKIKCPSFKPNGTHCECQWDFGLCKKVGVFTKEQVQEFELGLSRNWIRQFTIQCPKCKQNLFEGDLKTKRVRCPICNYGDFCSVCCKKWIGSDNNICGNKGCNITNQYLESSPWDKVFQLNDKSTKKSMTIKGPKVRACPICFTLIEHQKGCKHMECKNCKISFCWICLQLKQNNNWKCGSFSDYCGKIAPVQKLN